MVDADWLFLFWLQLLNHGVSFINCSAAICMQQAVPTLLEILYWRLLTYIIKSFDLFFLFLWIILVSRTPKSLSIGWTTSGEAASHPVNLIRLGNIHLDRPIYMSLLCVMIKRELAEAYIIFFFNVLKSSWTEKCQGSTPKVPNRRHLFSLVEFCHPISSSIYIALLFSTPVQLLSVGG